MKAALGVLCVLLSVSFVLARPTSVQYPDEHLPEGNTTVLAIAVTAHYTHVFALGKEGALWHQYKTTGSADWTKWILRAKAVNGTWDSDPAVGVNSNGVVEVFIRYSTNLDVWQMYQTDPTNPEAWTEMREASCVDMAGCSSVPPGTKYWNSQPVFPTSDLTIVNSPIDGGLQLYYRGFDGALYMVQQGVPGVSDGYTAPVQFQTIIE